MDQNKPHRGSIRDWYRLPCRDDFGLGYVIRGHSPDHPEFGSGLMQTSYVVKHEGQEIETRNSRYTLVGDET